MRVRRGLLFWGLFLIPLGAVPLIVQAGGLDGDVLADIWRLWPLVLIAVGILLVLRRTRAAVAGTAVIALTLGLFGGAVLAAAPSSFPAFGDCRPGGNTQHYEQAGSFTGPASVRLDFRCGTLDVAATDAPGWRIDAAYTADRPTIDARDDGLAVRSAGATGRVRDAWTIELPAAQTHELRVVANAVSGAIDLGPASLDTLTAEFNAGDIRIVAGSGGTDHLQFTMNAGRMRLETGRAAMAGSMSINAGAIDLCVPDDVGLRLDVTEQLTFATNLSAEGLTHSGSLWTRSAAAGAPLIELSIEGNAAALTLKGEGACR
ncbi:MAG TPA: hypothetical protein VFV72_08035 [Candidatus Limnocylindrales bacterium]|nr:hypothetical protein [Candidatus Limnocylindrales bacterium]